ncbi:hypothetical protein FOZ63_028521 [Perkinsus olseni]|uniref:Uncharacterized protein n=1 Tax=Perkinsus olseni TaxID=32597 RepID=A0A7J6TF81_PEROL|nr:hypothetical protein FOZ63_028521 [Perkinsus olseni]
MHPSPLPSNRTAAFRSLSLYDYSVYEKNGSLLPAGMPTIVDNQRVPIGLNPAQRNKVLSESSSTYGHDTPYSRVITDKSVRFLYGSNFRFDEGGTVSLEPSSPSRTPVAPSTTPSATLREHTHVFSGDTPYARDEEENKRLLREQSRDAPRIEVRTPWADHNSDRAPQHPDGVDARPRYTSELDMHRLLR